MIKNIDKFERLSHTELVKLAFDQQFIIEELRLQLEYFKAYKNEART